jgi:hypothetical protein
MGEFYLFRGKPTARCIPCIKARRKELRAEHRGDDYKFKRAINSTGARGVTILKRKSGQTVYRAKGTLDGKRIHLGNFEDVLDAICAASDFRIQHDLNK